MGAGSATHVHPGAVAVDGFAIEPMVAAGSGRAREESDGWTISTRDHSLAAHYEDTIVITHGRPVVLTEAAA